MLGAGCTTASKWSEYPRQTASSHSHQWLKHLVQRTFASISDPWSPQSHRRSTKSTWSITRKRDGRVNEVESPLGVSVLPLETQIAQWLKLTGLSAASHCHHLIPYRWEGGPSHGSHLPDTAVTRFIIYATSDILCIHKLKAVHRLQPTGSLLCSRRLTR